MRFEAGGDAEPVAPQTMLASDVGQRRAGFQANQGCINGAPLKQANHGTQSRPGIIRAVGERRIERLHR